MSAKRLLLAGGCALAAAPSYGATLVVNDLSDQPGTCPGVPCTLRAALAAAGNGDRIEFDPDFGYPSSLVLGGSELAISADLTLAGPGPDRLTISAGAASRVFNISAGSVRIEGLALANGRRVTATGSNGMSGTGQGGASPPPAEGGCLRLASGATLVLERVALVNCQASGGDAGHGGSGSSGAVGGPGGPGGNGGSALGGAIASFGSLSLIDSSIQGALAIGGRGGDGGPGGSGMPGGMGGIGGSGGAARGTAIYAAAGSALLVRNSTLVASSASGGAGGLGGVSNGLPGAGGNGGMAEGGQLYLGALLTLADVEFASLGPALLQGGSAGAGAGGAPPGADGLARGEAVFAGSVPRVRHAVFAGDQLALDCQGTIDARGANFDSDTSCGGFTLHGDFADHFVGPAVQELAGRAVLLPRTGAAPIDAASDCADLDGADVPVDGVGRPRPQDGDGNGSASCDVGAFEFDLRIFRDGFEPAG